MKRGLFFTLTTLSLFSILFLLAANKLLESSQSSELVETSLLRKISFAWDDVNEDVDSSLNLSITQSGNNLSIGDFLPAPRNLGASLLAYATFVEYYYKPPELNFSYVSATGATMSLSALGPPLQILPFGMNYTYPDYGKNELFIRVPAANFSQVREVQLNYSLPDHWFNENLSRIAGDPCSFWAPLHTCNAATTNCLNLSLRITDRNNTLYANNASCNRFNADQNSNLQLNLNYSGGSNAWIKVLIGQLPDLVNVKLQNTNVSTNTTLVFNSSGVSINAFARLRVLAPAYNASKTDTIKS